MQADNAKCLQTYNDEVNKYNDELFLKIIGKINLKADKNFGDDFRRRVSMRVTDSLK